MTVYGLDAALATLETVRNPGRSEEVDPLQRVLGSMGITGAEAERLTRFCTGERIERTGCAALIGTGDSSEDSDRRSSTTVALMERVAS